MVATEKVGEACRKKIDDLTGKRDQILTEMRGLLDAAQQAGQSDLSQEDAETYAKMEQAVQGLNGQMAREKRHAELDLIQAETRASAGRKLPSGQGEGEFERRNKAAGRDEDAYDRERTAVTREKRGARFATQEYRRAWETFLRRGQRAAPVETRDLALAPDTEGGYLVAPEQFQDELIRLVDNLVFMRKLATKNTVTGAKALGIPSLDARMGAANWGTELSSPTFDSTMKLGKRLFEPKPLIGAIKISMQLLQRTANGAEDLVNQEMAYMFGWVQETAFLTGDGTNQPLGVFTASANGISTARDITTGTTGVIGYADLNAMKMSLKQQYMTNPNTCWIMNRGVLSQITALTDTLGRPLYVDSMQAGLPARLLGYPIYMSEYAPYSLTSGKLTSGIYAAVLGDFSNYRIVDVVGEEGLSVQRLDELYAATSQVGFIGRAMVDGMPVKEEAFARLAIK